MRLLEVGHVFALLAKDRHVPQPRGQRPRAWEREVSGRGPGEGGSPVPSRGHVLRPVRRPFAVWPRLQPGACVSVLSARTCASRAEAAAFESPWLGAWAQLPWQGDRAWPVCSSLALPVALGLCHCVP